MSDPTNATPNDLRHAVETIHGAIHETHALRSRTEGLTWMVWGMVSMTLFVLFDATSWLRRGGPGPWWEAYLWLPLFLVGALVTYTLWRTAAVASPALRERQPVGLLVTASYLVYLLAAWFVVLYLTPGVNDDTIGILTIGSAWLFFGAVNPFRLTPMGRSTSAGIGIAMLGTGVALAAILPPDPAAANRLATMVGVLAGAGYPLLGGFWQATRG